MKRFFACVLCAVGLQATAAAHVLDQYLQVAQIALTADGVRIQLRLIPGAQIADRIFDLIDDDHDGQISEAEEQGYVGRVMRDLGLEVDGRSVPLVPVAVRFPSRSEMNDGDGAIRFDLSSQAPLDTVGEHRLSFRNDHLPELGVYLANALVPTTDAIVITGQQRDMLQHGLQVSFRVVDGNASGWSLWTGLLLLGLCLTLLLPKRKLISLLRRFKGERLTPKKTFS
ncbi:MAG: hypothetical protein ABI882_16275 [Acidobacteriota bacterium]